MACICFVVGARPNFMKAAPVHRALGATDPDIDRLLVHTGQHYDEGMSSVFIRELGLPEPDVFLGVGSGSHAEQTARALVSVEGVLREHAPDLVVVSGDVNSTLAAALAAVKLHIRVAHIESGLRSFDDTMPEEHNRRLTDHLSSLLLAHSADAVRNLRCEGIDDARIRLVGNTMIDSVFDHVDAARARAPWESFGFEPRTYVLVTLHRPTLVDSDALLTRTVRALDHLAETMPVIFPAHPRTRATLARLGLDKSIEREGIHVCEPLGYLDFLGLEAEARAVVTDSGGVQEETSALGVPCFTLRASTERPITVELGTNTILGLDPERIAEVPFLLDDDRTPSAIPLWDGRAGIRTAEALIAFLR